MIVALSQMSPGATAVFFLVALILLIVAGFLARPIGALSLLAWGLAAWMLVLTWNALAAA